MISRALNAQNDIFVRNGRIVVAQNAAEVIQHTRTRILFYLEEWFLDTTAGTPWFQQVFIKPVNLVDIENIIKARILLTPGVSRLTAFSMDIDRTNRLLSVTYAGETIYGEIISDEVYVND